MSDLNSDEHPDYIIQNIRNMAESKEFQLNYVHESIINVKWKHFFPYDFDKIVHQIKSNTRAAFKSTFTKLHWFIEAFLNSARSEERTFLARCQDEISDFEAKLEGHRREFIVFKPLGDWNMDIIDLGQSANYMMHLQNMYEAQILLLKADMQFTLVHLLVEDFERIFITEIKRVVAANCQESAQFGTPEKEHCLNVYQLFTDNLNKFALNVFSLVRQLYKSKQQTPKELCQLILAEENFNQNPQKWTKMLGQDIIERSLYSNWPNDFKLRRHPRYSYWRKMQINLQKTLEEKIGETVKRFDTSFHSNAELSKAVPFSQAQYKTKCIVYFTEVQEIDRQFQPIVRHEFLAQGFYYPIAFSNRPAGDFQQQFNENYVQASNILQWNIKNRRLPYRLFGNNQLSYWRDKINDRKEVLLSHAFTWKSKDERHNNADFLKEVLNDILKLFFNQIRFMVKSFGLKV